MHYFYLHGFASSPQSAKARSLRDRFARRAIDLKVIDLNQGDFSHLTLTRQLQQVGDILPQTPATLIGSSFGGLSAAWLGQRYESVERLVLLAPAFQFLSHWLPTLGARSRQQWQATGYLPIYHYGEGRSLPLHYEFVRDLQQYRETDLQRPVETLILHGKGDRVIPIQASRDYARSRDWVQLLELDSNHTLGNAIEVIWKNIQQFCYLDAD